jgi:ATP-dependent Zn protease
MRTKDTPQPQPFDVTEHPGFALAKAFAAHHSRLSIADALAQCDDTPPHGMVEEEEEEDCDWLQQQKLDLQPPKPSRPGLPMDLLLILSLAKGIAAAGGGQPGGPCRVSRIDGVTTGMLMALETLFAEPLISGALLDPLFNTVDLHNCLTTAEPRLRDEKLRGIFKKVTAQLIRGRGAILLGLGSDPVPGELEPLCPPPLRLPPPDRAMMMALLALRYPQAVDPLLPEALPPDHMIVELSFLTLAAALQAPTRDAALAGLHRFCSRPAAKSELPGLDEVAGQPAAVTQLRRLAEDVAQWRAGHLPWGKVPRSLILHGVPGTGKTLLASAFAAEAGLPLVATSFAECQKFGHLGDMLAALDAAVSEAVTRAPSVFFLDELDGFNTRDNKDIGRGNGYMRAVITGLLRQLDRLMATPGVVLIGATNDLAAIDPALRRAGRFDATLLIQPASKQGMAQILRRHLSASHDPELETVITLSAARLVGTNGAEAAALARAALAHARATGGALAQALLAELDKRLPGRAEYFDRRIAVHEAGHAVVGMLSGLPAPLALRIDRAGGSTVWEMPPLHSYETALAEIKTLLAGRAAEQVLLGNVSNGSGLGPQSDLALATDLAVRMETEWGLGDGGLIWQPNTPLNLRHGQQWLREKLNHTLNTAYAEARTIIATHRELVLDLADALLNERELTGPKLSQQLDKIRQVQRWGEEDETRSINLTSLH